MAYESVTADELSRYRSARPGVVAFVNVILFLFRGRGAASAGIYNRRPRRGSSGPVTPANASLHAVGRALDIAGPPALLAEIWLRCIFASSKLGICEVIYNRQRWTAEHGIQRYDGVDPHTSHVHVGFTRAWAALPVSDALHKWIAGALLGQQ